MDDLIRQFGAHIILFFYAEYHTVYDTHYDTKCYVHYDKKCAVHYETTYEHKYKKECATTHHPRCKTHYATTYVEECHIHHEKKCKAEYHTVYDTKVSEDVELRKFGNILNVMFRGDLMASKSLTFFDKKNLNWGGLKKWQKLSSVICSFTQQGHFVMSSCPQMKPENVILSQPRVERRVFQLLRF